MLRNWTEMGGLALCGLCCFSCVPVKTPEERTREACELMVPKFEESDCSEEIFDTSTGLKNCDVLVAALAQQTEGFDDPCDLSFYFNCLSNQQFDCDAIRTDGGYLFFIAITGCAFTDDIDAFIEICMEHIEGNPAPKLEVCEQLIDPARKEACPALFEDLSSLLSLSYSAARMRAITASGW